MGITNTHSQSRGQSVDWKGTGPLGQAEKTGTLPLALGLAGLSLGLFLGFVIFI